MGEQVNTFNVKYIWVTFRKEGIHKYPDAPKGVTFLKFPHRHIFHFKVKLEVFHDDREVEFILFKREIEKMFDDGILQLNNNSFVKNFYYFSTCLIPSFIFFNKIWPWIVL